MLLSGKLSRISLRRGRYDLTSLSPTIISSSSNIISNERKEQKLKLNIMMIITECPKCRKDFMYDPNKDTHLMVSNMPINTGALGLTDQDLVDHDEWYPICQDCYFLEQMESKIEEAFKSDLGQQVDELFSTSDSQIFIRLKEAKQHTNDMINSVGGLEYVDTTIYSWYEQWSGGDVDPTYVYYKV